GRQGDGRVPPSGPRRPPALTPFAVSAHRKGSHADPTDGRGASRGPRSTATAITPEDHVATRRRWSGTSWEERHEACLARIGRSARATRARPCEGRGGGAEGNAHHRHPYGHQHARSDDGPRGE